MIPPDPHAILLIDVGHVYWTAWHGSQESAPEAYSYTYEFIMSCVRNWTHVIVCVDSPRNWRHELSAEYKANRKAKPQAAVDGLVDVIDRVRANGVPVAGVDGYEADDIIATLVAQSWLHRVVIRSDDKDLAQLVSDDVTLWTRSGLRGPAEVQAKYGVPPRQIRDLLALWGDTSDNVQGCDGIGQAKACAVLEKFGSIEAMTDRFAEWLEQPEEMRPPNPLAGLRGIGSKLTASLFEWDPALSLALVSLKTDAPVSLDALLSKQTEQPKEIEYEW